MNPEVELKPGEQTTEYKQTQSANVWGIIATILGFLMSAGGAVAESFGADTKGAVIVGAVVAVCGLCYRTFVQLGYIKARADVKVAAETTKAINIKTGK